MESHWQDLAEVLLPRRADFTLQRSEGEKRTREIYDGTPQLARRGLSAALDGLIKPKTSRWFHIRADDDDLNDDDTVKAWLEAVEDRMWNTIYARSARFIQRSGEVDDDLVTFGTGVLFTGENRRLEGLTFRSHHLRDTLIAESGDGVVDTVLIDMRLTARQAAGLWGADALSKKVREALTKDRGKERDEEFLFVQAVTPREDLDPRRLDDRKLPFAHLVLEVESESEVEASGFHELPFAVPRWDTVSGELYGRSPGMLALPDARTLQAMDKTLLTAGQKAADPPVWALDDGVTSPVRTFPGGITYIDGEAARALGRPPMGPLDLGKNIPLGREMQRDRREMVFAAFFRNVLQLPVGAPQMTATEVLERKEEFLRTMGPVFGRLESDYIGVVAERVFGIEQRAGRLPEPPEALAGRQVRFEFASPLDRARRAIEAAGLSRAMEVLAPLASV